VPNFIPILCETTEPKAFWWNDGMAAILKVCFRIRNPILSIDAHSSRNNPAQFHPDPIWNDRALNDAALGYFWRGHLQQNNNNNNKNKASSKRKSVPGVKIHTPSHHHKLLLPIFWAQMILCHYSFCSCCITVWLAENAYEEIKLHTVVHGDMSSSKPIILKDFRRNHTRVWLAVYTGWLSWLLISS